MKEVYSMYGCILEQGMHLFSWNYVVSSFKILVELNLPKKEVLTDECRFGYAGA
jgi:hypothetical protein